VGISVGVVKGECVGEAYGKLVGLGKRVV